MALGDLLNKKVSTTQYQRPTMTSSFSPRKSGLSSLLQSKAQPSVQEDTQRALRQSENTKRRLIAAGQGDKIEKPSSFNILNLLEKLAAPGYAANAMIREFTNPEAGETPGEFDPLKAYWRGLTLKEKPSGGKIMKDIGVQNDKLAGVLGFAFDVINPLDALNWVTFGLGKVALKGGVKGPQALSKAFGDDTAKLLVNMLDDVADDIANVSAKNIGELAEKVVNIAKNSKVNTDDVRKLLTKGMAQTHSTYNTKLPYEAVRKIQLKLEKPLGRKVMGSVDVPGSQYVTKAAGTAKEKFFQTGIGDKLGKMFSTKYKPKGVPDSVILRNIQEKGAKVVQETAERGQREILEEAPEIISNTMKIGPEVNKAVERAVKLDEVSGTKIFEEFKQGLGDLFRKVPRKEEDFFKEVAVIFKDTSPAERQLVLDNLLDSSVELPEHLMNVAERFRSWRSSIIKQYHDLQIPVHELENYVPHIPVKGTRLTGAEKAGLKSVFGDVASDELRDPNLIDIIDGIDPSLRQRTIPEIDPRKINEQLGRKWLSEDPAHMMMARGSRAIRGIEASKYIDDFLDKFGLTPEDLIELKETSRKLPKGYGYFENVVDKSGVRTLKQVTKIKDGKNIVALPEEFADIFNKHMEIFFNKDSKGAVMRLFDQATTSWKKMAYLYKPGHIPRDTTGNLWQGYLMGISNPKVYKESAENLKKIPKITERVQELIEQTGKKLKLDMDKSDIDTIINIYKKGIKDDLIEPLTIKLNGKYVDAFEAFHKARKYGALETIAVMAETPRTIRRTLDLVDETGVKKALGTYEDIMRKWTETSNNWARFAGYLDQVSKGESWTKAAANVKKFYFDYFDLTPFEKKYMKRLVPFYTWTRKNIPMEVEALIRRPKDFARVRKAMDAVEGDEYEEAKMPDWARDVGLIALGNTGKYFNPNIPYQDLGRLPISGENIANLLASINPLIRGPAELASNVQLYSGKPLEKYAGETRDMPFIGSLLKRIGVDEKDIPQIQKRGLGYIFEQFPVLKDLDTILSPDHPRRTARAGSFVGIPSYFDAEQLKRSEIYEENRRLLELLQLLRDRGIEIPTTEELDDDTANDILKQLGLK